MITLVSDARSIVLAPEGVTSADSRADASSMALAGHTGAN
jgi:hypothetical protein